MAEINKILSSKELIELVLKDKLTDEELAKRTVIPKSTIGRILRNKDIYTQIYKEQGLEIFEKVSSIRQENLRCGKKLGALITQFNEAFNRGDITFVDGKYNLDILFSDTKKQMIFLSAAALTFRLHLGTLSQMFLIDENVLYQKMKESIYCYDILSCAVDDLFKYDNTNQLIAKKEFFLYYSEFIKAKSEKNYKTINNLMDVIFDSKINEVKEYLQKGGELTDELAEIIVKYQIKYSLTVKKILEMFNTTKFIYLARLNHLFANNKELQNQYENLINQNQAFILKGSKK